MSHHCVRADTVTGANILRLEREFGQGVLEMTGRQFRSQYRAAPVPEEEEWRINLLLELLQEVDTRVVHIY